MFIAKLDNSGNPVLSRGLVNHLLIPEENNARGKPIMKYYFVRILAALFIMGSFGVGFLSGGEYGRLVGWTSFIILFALGLILHIAADRKFKKV